jgi:hypothetical protein
MTVFCKKKTRQNLSSNISIIRIDDQSNLKYRKRLLKAFTSNIDRTALHFKHFVGLAHKLIKVIVAGLLSEPTHQLYTQY